MRRKKQLRGAVTFLIIAFVLWQFWQKVHFNFWVQIPWWGVLLFIVLIVVILERLVERVMGD
jgi:uncharacterized membrane protein (DUF4010 family)